jgi:anti-sigma factor RsiW
VFLNRRHTRACRLYEARLEDYFEGRLLPDRAIEVEAHLSGCADCREALEMARAGTRLFAAGQLRAPEPRPDFSQRVLAAIRGEEPQRLAGGDFWRPLEMLAWRLSLVSMLLLAVLAGYLFSPQFLRRQQPARAQEIEMQDIFPESAPHPADRNEVLLTLASTNATGKRINVR